MPVLGPVRCDDGLLGLRCRLIRMARSERWAQVLFLILTQRVAGWQLVSSAIFGFRQGVLAFVSDIVQNTNCTVTCGH